MTAPVHDRRPVDLRVVARHWLPICRARLAAKRAASLTSHARSMRALQKVSTTR